MLSIFILLATGAGAFEFQDAFNYADGVDAMPAWASQSIMREVRNGALVCDGGGRSFAVLQPAPHARRMTFEASVQAEARR